MVLLKGTNYAGVGVKSVESTDTPYMFEQETKETLCREKTHN